MHPSDDMSRVVDGKRYSVKTATLVASDEYWDGHNYEHMGRNCFLYRTPKGAFFQVNLTQWQGERDTLIPISEEEARELYEGPLTEHSMTWEKAFGREPEEPEPAGRPPLYDETMSQTAFRLPVDQLEWLRGQPNGMSETVRRLVQEEMDKQ